MLHFNKTAIYKSKKLQVHVGKVEISREKSSKTKYIRNLKTLTDSATFLKGSLQPGMGLTQIGVVKTNDSIFRAKA